VTVRLSAGLTTAPASAGEAADRRDDPDHHKPGPFNGYYRTYISGVIPMSQAEAQNQIANLGNGGVEYDLFADDPGVGDDDIMMYIARGASLPGQKPNRYLYAAPDGLRSCRRAAT
jgi:hypothetical protein